MRQSEIIKLPPPHSVKFFSQEIQPATPDGREWGGVPWDKAISVDDNYWGLFGKIQRFPNPANPSNTIALAGMTDLDTDTDGPGGSTAVDPCWQGETSLRYRDGSSCDSRKFPGIVIPPGLNAYGLRVGDFGYVSLNGRYMSVQIYDYGPTKKIGEAAERVVRGLGVVPPDESSHRAAEGDYPTVTNLFMLLFPGTRPVNPDPNKSRWCAADQATIEAKATEAFYRLTGRQRDVASN